MRASAVLASLLTLGLVGLLASRRKEDGVWGLLAAGGLLVTSLGWQTHAFEVRTDTYTAPLTLAAAALLFRSRVSARSAVAAGLLVGAAGLISQKSIYNGVALGVGWIVFQVLVARAEPLRTTLRTAGIAALAAGLSVAGWYGGMGVLSGSESFVSDNLGTAVDTGFAQVWPLAKNLGTIGATASRALALWVFAPIALIAAVWHGRSRPTQGGGRRYGDGAGRHDLRPSRVSPVFRGLVRAVPRRPLRRPPGFGMRAPREAR